MLKYQWLLLRSLVCTICYLHLWSQNKFLGIRVFVILIFYSFIEYYKYRVIHKSLWNSGIVRATTKTDTAERDVSIGRESLQVFSCAMHLGVLAGFAARGLLYRRGRKSPRDLWITLYSWSQAFALFCILYAFFWVIPRRLKFICRRFGTLSLFHLHRQVGVSIMN